MVHSGQFVRMPGRNRSAELGSRPRSLAHLDLDFPTLWGGLCIPLSTLKRLWVSNSCHLQSVWVCSSPKESLPIFSVCVSEGLGSF